MVLPSASSSPCAPNLLAKAVLVLLQVLVGPYNLDQTWATYGPRAGSGPRDHFTRPAGTYKNVTLYRESSRTSFTLL